MALFPTVLGIIIVGSLALMLFSFDKGWLKFLSILITYLAVYVSYKLHPNIDIIFDNLQKIANR